MSEMTVQQIQEAIRIAESAGDLASAEELRNKLQHLSINS